MLCVFLFFLLAFWRTTNTLWDFTVTVETMTESQNSPAVDFVELGSLAPRSHTSTTGQDNDDTTEKKDGPTLSVVLRTWYEDAALAVLGLESVIQMIDESMLLEIVIVTDEDSEPTVRSELYNPIAMKFPELRDHQKLLLHVEPTLLRNGHIQQKYSKMMADTYTKGDYILHIDSDCVITRWDDECFLEDGKPVNDFASFESLSDTGVEVWKEGTEAFLGIPVERYEYSRLNQHVYPRALYSVLRARAEYVHGLPFLDVFEELNAVGTYEDKTSSSGNDTVLISDFNLLGATAFHFAPDLMTPKNLTEGTTPWRPLCVVQCNSRALGSQCCEQWLAQQTRLAHEGKATSSHVSCKTDFPPGDPCHCTNES